MHVFSSAYSPEWSTSGSPILTAASLPPVISSAVISGGKVIYPGIPEPEEVLEYGLQSEVHYSDTGTIPGGDGDHIGMGQVRDTRLSEMSF